MAPAPDAAETGVDLWPLICRPDTALADAALPAADSAALARAVARFARLAGPALADHLLRPAADRLGLPRPDPAAVERSRLGGRFALAQQRRWVGAVAEAGIEAVCLKGFATAHTLYPDPAMRLQGDLDLLVREADLDRIVGLLAGRGFRFRTAPSSRLRLLSDASFMPLVAADGSCDIDLHVRPDGYPAHLSLTTARVFAAARTVESDGLSFRVPSPEHSFVLCITNAARDKFDLFSLRKVIDAIRLTGRNPDLDWDAVAGLAQDGRFLRPARVFCALLVRLGMPAGRMPAALREPPAGLGRGTFERVVADFRTLFPAELPLLELWWRELSLAAEPGVALHNLGRRLRGLVWPDSGLPAGVSPETGLPRRS